MYIPASFAETDLHKLHDLMRAYNFALLVSSGDSAPDASHLPFMIDPDAGEYGTLITHMARANPHWKSLNADEEVLVIFQGAHSYISPRWYASQPAVVPTWNYAAVHAYGKPRLIHDPALLKPIVMALVAQHEGPELLPGIDTAFPENLLQAIVGVEIPITRLEGKFKMSQNRSEDDQRGVIAALEQSRHSDQQAVAAIMRENVKQRTEA
jgi:transcriptional regulator